MEKKYLTKEEITEKWGNRKCGTISDVEKILGETQPTLRVWCDSFTEILPIKTNAHKTRLYSLESVLILRDIQFLIRECGYKHTGALAKLKADSARTRKNCDIASRLGKVREQLLALRLNLNENKAFAETVVIAETE
ncbi:MAG: MerR family transcriptional regulator [Prevotellaceae bacterium]|jgi:DNA-binding transcriptional MerR regulator|nr:MerR family transcriptional regulator [Prevotellaceae bacterium]